MCCHLSKCLAILFVTIAIQPLVLAADSNAWLETDLPPLIEPGKEPPVEITSIKLSHNHCDQELLDVECRRTGQITTIPEEVKLVILPSRGGRYPVTAPRGMFIGPGRSERFGGISNRLLNYRGEIPGGARAYMEMRKASPIDNPPPVRISKVYWIGTTDQLTQAMKSPPPKVEPGQSPNVETVELPANIALPLGTPLQFQIGGGWSPAKVAEETGTTGDLIVQVFLARPGGLYKPWIADADRRFVRIETDALKAVQENPNQFAVTLRNQQQLVSSMKLGPAQRLKAATPQTVVAGQRLLTFSLGNLTSLEATGPAEDGVVPVRNPKGGQESRVELANLYIDPEGPKPAANATAANIPPANTNAKSSPERSSVPTAEPRYRKWKDSSGKFEIDAALVSVDNDVVKLLRKDGKEINLPLSRLSGADQKFIEQSRNESANPFDP